MKILLKKEVCGSREQCTRPTDRHIFQSWAWKKRFVGPMDYKRQTQNVGYFNSIQTLTKSLTMIPWTEMNNGVNRKLLGSNLHRNLFSNCQLATLISPLFSRMLSSSFFRWIETNREGDLSFFRMLSSSLQSRKNVFLIKKEKRKEKKKYLTLWNKN